MGGGGEGYLMSIRPLRDCMECLTKLG
jgi:hypothetical protein